MSTHGDDQASDDQDRQDQRPRPAPDATSTFRPLGAETTHLGGVAPRAAGEDEAATEAGVSGEQQRAVDALPQGAALLLVQSGANAGARFLLDAPTTTVGRHPGSDIFLDDVTVSRRHAEFARDRGGFAVRDAGSLNGTYVNRERVDTHQLAAGDEVQIGKYRLTYHPHRPPS